jgi:hypothetical protein
VRIVAQSRTLRPPGSKRIVRLSRIWKVMGELGRSTQAFTMSKLPDETGHDTQSVSTCLKKVVAIFAANSVASLLAESLRGYPNTVIKISARSFPQNFLIRSAESQTH